MKFHDLTQEEAKELATCSGIITAADVAAELRHIVANAEKYAEDSRIPEPDAAELFHARQLGALHGEIAGFAALLDRISK